MGSLKNKTSSMTFIPCDIVILEKDNIVTWIATNAAAYLSINLQLSEFGKISYKNKSS